MPAEKRQIGNSFRQVWPKWCVYSTSTTRPLQNGLSTNVQASVILNLNAPDFVISTAPTRRHDTSSRPAMRRISVTVLISVVSLFCLQYSVFTFPKHRTHQRRRPESISNALFSVGKHHIKAHVHNVRISWNKSRKKHSPKRASTREELKTSLNRSKKKRALTNTT